MYGMLLSDPDADTWWLILAKIVVVFVFLIVMTIFVIVFERKMVGVGETNRAPFDLAEAESELVSGFHTEYSSMRFALIQMAEYVNMITASAVGANLFFGGWHFGIAGVPDSPLWFIGKMMAFLFLFIWLRGTVPRFRYDQLMHFGWKVLVPIAMAWIFVAAALVLVRQS
jgi:NADH-quinone oxidoreductase subunit H